MNYLIILFGLILLLLLLNRIARRSGVTDEDLKKTVAGDELVPDAVLVMDRAALFDATPPELWQWIAQLGKERAGWYAPAWIEWVTRRIGLYGIRQIDPTLQQIAVGDIIADWGPGDPIFKAMLIEPERALVYLTMRDPAANWTWPPSENPPPNNSLILSWALILEPLTEGKTRFYLRLRGKRQGKPISWVFHLFGGLIDYLTIILLFAGLRERLHRA